MSTSSAEPARLEAYPGQLTEADEQLTTVASELDTAMSRFALGSHAYLPQGFDSAWAGNLVRGLRDESQHLARWVASVGAAFRAADTDPDGDGIFTADDTFLAQRVGEPTIAGAQAEASGRQAALDLQAALRANGIDPSQFTPEQLHNLILNVDNPEVRALYDQMRAIGGNMWDPAYASGFYDEMGTEGIRTTLGVIDTFAHLRRSEGLVDDRDWLGSVQDNLLAPFVGGWALATRSPDTADERAGLLDTRDPIEQRHLSLLMSGPANSYDPQWLADGAERILVTGTHLNRPQAPMLEGSLRPPDYPGFSHEDWLYEDKGLGVPQLIAARALDGNDDAGLNFLQRGKDHIHALTYPDFLRGGSPSNFHEFEQLQNELESHSANVVQFGVTHPDERVREPLMTNVIDVVVDERQPLNPHIYGSLAAGVEHNMELIDDRINTGWSEVGQGYTHDPKDPTMTRTQSFLTELMGDDGARDRVRTATRDYVQNRLDGLPVRADGERPDDDLNELGRIFGVVADADIAAATEEFEQAGDRAALAGRVADYAIGWIPYGVGHANDVAQVVEVSVGHWIEEGLNPDDAEFKRNLRNLLIEHRDVIEGLPLVSDDIAQMRRGAHDAELYS